MVDVSATVVYYFVHAVLNVWGQVFHVTVRLVNLVYKTVVFALRFISVTEGGLVLGAVATWTALTGPGSGGGAVLIVEVTLFGLVATAAKMVAVEIFLVLVWVLLICTRSKLLILKLFLPSRHHILGVIPANIHIVSLSNADSRLLLNQVCIWIFLNPDPRKPW